MSLTADVQSALSLLERLQGSMRGCEDPRVGVQLTNDINTLISVLHNPLLNKLISIQDSLQDLKCKVMKHPSLMPKDFTISKEGKLVFEEGRAVSSSVTSVSRQGAVVTSASPAPFDKKAASVDVVLPPPVPAARSDKKAFASNQNRAFSMQESGVSNSLDHRLSSHDDPLWKDSEEETTATVANAQVDSIQSDRPDLTTSLLTNSFDGDDWQRFAHGREIHHIKLFKPDGTSLGFSVVGLKSEQRGDLGIYVQDIQATGRAAKDGRLRDGDQILAIDGQVLESTISHEQAISILQKASKVVDLVVARAPNPDQKKILTSALSSDRLQQQSLRQETPTIATTTAQRSKSFDEKDPPPPYASSSSLLPTASSTPHIIPPTHESQPQSYNMLNTEWAQVEIIHLVNDGSGLGFGIIGGRSTGVVVKTIIPGGVADRDGHLRSGDHILQIGDVNLRGMGSDQVAAVLRQAGSHVRLVVARPVESASPDYQARVGRHAPIVETRILNDPDELERHLNLVSNGFLPPTSTAQNLGGADLIISTGGGGVLSPGSTIAAGGGGGISAQNGHVDLNYINGDSEILTVNNQLASTSATAAVLSSEASLDPGAEPPPPPLVRDRPLLTPDPPLRDNDSSPSAMDIPVVEGGEGLSIADLPEMETILLTLIKDHQGLGITIAGYVCEKEELSGIFVKSINSGSAADRSGQVQVNDQIVEVDGKRLTGLSNHAAVEVLRATGHDVKLKLARYLRGPKFEQLQQAIANSELKTTPTTPNPPRAPLGDLPSSDAIHNALQDLDRSTERLEGDIAEAYNSNFQVSTAAIPTSEFAAATTPGRHTSIISVSDGPARSSDYPFYGGSGGGSANDLRDIQLMIDQDYEGEISLAVETAIQRKWARFVGPDLDIVVAQLRKFDRGGGLGISLEGTVDVEDGREVRPHHYIRSILPDGPVGRDGRLQSGDELLEVNSQKLLGLNHVEVVTILKELPQAVRIVCGRRLNGTATALHPIDAPTSDRDTFAARNILGGSLQNLLPCSERLVKAKSDGSLASSTAAAASSDNSSFTRMKSRSLEPLTGLAMWSSEPQEIQLVKGDRGLGFSILDYQDPLNPQETVIVIRSLVPGGVAEKDGRLIPGDRLVAVNGTSLENASLDTAVAVLKGAPKGIVCISVAKPVSVLESPGQLELILGGGDAGLSSGADSDLTEDAVTAKSEDDTETIVRNSLDEISRLKRKANDSILSTSYEHTRSGSSEPTSLEQDTSASVLMVPVATERLIGAPISSSTIVPTTDNVGEFYGGASSGDEDFSPRGSPYIGSKYIGSMGGPPLPKDLQKAIKVRKGADQLGINIEVVDQGQNGAVISSMVRGGAVHKDGRLRAGDFIISVNNESMRNITNSQARAILRRTQLVSTDINITYIPGHDAAQYRESVLHSFQKDSEKQHERRSPRSPFVSAESSEEDLLTGDIPRSVTAPSFVTKQLKSRDNSEDDLLISQEPYPDILQAARDTGSPAVTVVNLKNAISEVLGTEDSIGHSRLTRQPSSGDDAGPFTITFRNVTEAGVVCPQDIERDSVDGILQSSISVSSSGGDSRSTNGSNPIIDGKRWGPERLVEVRRDENKSLGISIVGGKVDVCWSGSSVSGIFVKNVLPNSPAGKSGLLKTGDRILEVEGIDLREASHEKAVEVIKKTGDPVTFLVQSLIQVSPPNSTPVSRDVSRMASHPIESTPPARTPTPELIQAGLPDAKKQELQEERSTFFLQSKDEEAIKEVESEEESEEEDQDNDDEEIDVRQLQGKTTTAKGKQIERASAGAVKLSKSERGNEEEDEFGYHSKKIEKRYGSSGDVRLIDLQKGSTGLGISLAGHKDRTQMSVFVCGLNPSGNAYKDGRIRVGDEVLEANGIVLQGRSHLNASAIFKSLPDSSIKIVIRRKSTGLKDMAVKPITHFPVTLDDESPEERYSRFRGLTKFVMKKGQSGLGIMIIEGKHSDYGQGIFISDLQEGSIAAEAGLMVGDMILGVNKEDMIGVDYEQAANILKKAEGIINMWVANSARINHASSPGRRSATTAGSASKSDDHKKPEISPKPMVPPKPVLPTKPSSLGGLPSNTFAATMSTTGSPPAVIYTSSKITPSHHGDVLSSATTVQSSTGTSFNTPLPAEEPQGDPHTAEIKPGKETVIEIVKEKMGLGLSIVGGSDTLLGAIIIHEVYPDGAAAKDGRLKPGDQILEVNNENFRVITHQKALNVLRQTPSKVKMVVYREETPQKEEDMYDITLVQLTKKSGKGLGLSIVGRKNGPGVFISDLVPSGVAESDGRLMQGDQILEVNDKDLRNATQEQAAAILKCAPASVAMKIGRLKVGKKVAQPANTTWPVTISDSGSPQSPFPQPPMLLSSHIVQGAKQQQAQSTPPQQTPLNAVKNTSGGSSVPLPHREKANLGPPHSTVPTTDGSAVSTPTSAVLSLSSGGGAVPPSGNSPLRTVHLERGEDGLGFSIVGGFGSNLGDLPIYVKSVFDRGAASREGTLRRGDQILRVNGQSLTGLTHAQSVAILKEVRGSVILTVLPSK